MLTLTLASELRGMRSEWPERVQSAGGRRYASIKLGPGNWQVERPGLQSPVLWECY